MNARVNSRIIGALLILLAVCTGTARAGGQPSLSDGRFLSREEIRLHGLKLTVSPPEQVVPKDIATIVSTFLQAPIGSDPTVSPFAPDAEVRATLRGPGLAAPIDMAVAPGNPFNIPALRLAGIYTLDNIRLVSNGEVLLRGTPESARIEVIDKLLVSQVTARALTADEIRERGIVFDRTNFQAYNFSAAFAIQDTPITINFPVLLPRLAGAEAPDPTNQSIPGVPTPSIPQLATIIPDTLKLQTKLPNLQVVGFTLKMPNVTGNEFIVPPIPGIIAIPGDIGFLNQYFSVMLMVGNVAPANSNLVVSQLSAEILLPPGRDNVPNTPDDPLRMAMTSRGESPRIQVIAQAGPDGKLGTADDIATVGPGESGNAEYLVEGRREGSHIVEMRISGTLNGLPVGPVPVTGIAMGAVLVRNPTFTLTFTHPEVVTAGEPYTLDVTVTNTSASPANFVSLNLNAQHVGGATVVGAASRDIESIPPGDSATVSFDLIAKVTGKVFAATLDADEGVTGRFGLKTSVGELGVPLSPDSLVLPQEASKLPKPLRDAAIGLLGKAWAVATAPPAAVPADLQRFSRKIVLDRAVEVAEAGLRVTLGEPLHDSATQLAVDFLGSNFPRLPQRTPDAETLEFERTNFKGFDLLRRRSIRGDVFADTIAGLLRDRLLSLGPSGFHRDLTEKISYRPGMVSVLAAAPGPLPVRMALVDGAGRGIASGAAGAKVTKEIPFGDLLRFTDVGGAVTGELAIVGAPEPGLFTVRLARAQDAAPNAIFSLSLVVPLADGTLRHVAFDNITIGQRPTLVFAPDAPYRLAIEWVELATTGDVPATQDGPITDPAPSIVSVVQRENADVITCDAKELNGPQVGRIVAVLFSEEVTPESVQDKLKPELIDHFAIDGNAVVGVALQPGRRIAYLALRDPFGPLVPRSLTIRNIQDPRGNSVPSDTRPMQATVTDAAGAVSGQVLRPDGTPAPHVNVRLFYKSPCEGDNPWIGISSKSTDAEGRFTWDRVLTALGARIIAIDPETGDVRDARFQVRADGQRLTVNIVFLGRGTVTGRTFGPDGRTPLKDTFVRVTSLTDQSQYAARTDAAGRYMIARVPVGSVVIDAVNTTAIAKTTVSDLIPFAGATLARDLVLMDAQSEPITLKRGTLRGFVLEANGQTPAPGVPVIAYYQSGSQPSINCPGVNPPPECPVAVTTSATDGAYAFPDVVAGSLRVQTFNQSSYEQGQIGVILAENQTLSANILLAGGLGTVRGLVIDPSGRPVAGASVGGGLSLTTTDAQGRFVLTDVPVGRREIVAASQEVGSLAKATVDLLYGGHEVQVTLVLDAMGSVSGVVTRSTGAPAPGIQVYVYKQEGDSVRVFGTIATDAQGGYRIDQVPAGSYKVSAFSADFSDGNITPVVVAFHKQVARADVQFRGGGGRVTGRVFADDGATPLRARVSVSGEQVVVAGGVLGVEFRRVENFRIVDTNLTTGKYALAGLFVGPFTLRAAGVFSPDPIAVEAVMPGPGQEIEVNLRLQPTSQLTGTVYLPDGVTPVGANVPVHFKSSAFKTICTEGADGESTCTSFPQGVQGADAVTDANGVYLFPVLNAGTYTLTIDGPDGRAAVVHGSLPAGQQGRMDVRLLAKADLTVRVFAANATTPIPNARVEVSQVGAPAKKVTFQANSEGIVTFTGADAFSEGDVVIIATDLRNGATGRGRTKIVTDGQAVSTDVYLSTASGVVFGRVLRPDGLTPVPNAEVVVTSGADPVAFAVTDDQGRYREVGVPLGAIRVEVFEAATARRGGATGQITANGTQLELNVVEEALGVVRGRVVAAVTLQPLKNWRVTLSGRTPSGRSMPALVTTTGIDGGFSFPGTPLGAFTIQASKPGEPGQGQAAGSIVREGELVDVPVIATIPRQAVGTIAGSVVDRTGAPAANARVEIGNVAGGGTQTITASASGSFTFGPAPLGTYQIRATRQGSTDSGLTYVQLQFDTQTAPATVVLNGLSTVKGVVTQNGSPVSGARVTLTGQPDSGCGTACAVFADGSGNFTFERVSARTFTLVASDPNNVLRGSIGDTLTPGETKTVTVALEATRRLTGRVVNAAGDAVAGVVAEMTAAGSRRLFAETGTNGTFEFAALPLGAYVLDLRAATGPGMAARRGTIALDADLGDIVLDEAPPRVSTVTPLPGAVAVARNQALVVLFSEPIDRASINADSITLAGPGGPVALEAPVYRLGDSELLLQPSSQLQAETRYTVTITGVRDRAGRPMAVPFSSTFTTVDITPPALTDISPASGANGVTVYTTIRLRYSEPIAPSAFSGPAIQLLRNGTPVDGRIDVILGDTTVVFTPTLPLAEDAVYEVRAQAATDLSGNRQPQALTYSFSTTDRTPPQVTALVAAGDGTVIENGQTQVTAQVGASHDVSYVDFYLNDQIAFSARSEPFTLTLRAVPALGAPGSSIKVSALATDTSGNRSAIPATLLVPIKADAPPAVTLLAPAAGTSVPNGSQITIRLRATDDLGAVQVGYRVTIGGTVRTGTRAIVPASTDTTQQFDFIVPASAAPGALVHIEPTVTDSKGQAVAGAAVDVRVLDAAPPDVQITGLTSGTSLKPGQSATVVVAATDPGLVKSVTFSATASGTLTFTQTRAIEPAQASVATAFTFAVPPTARATETVTLTATAVDSVGNEAEAPTVILPIADLVAPSINLRTSTGSTVMVPGATVTVIAEAEDEIGVSSIQLTGSGAMTVADGRTFDPPQTSATATFTIQIPESVALGSTLQLQARALDGAQNISAPKTLTLTAGEAIGVTLPSSVIVNAGSTQAIDVTLSAPAGAAGVRVDLSTQQPSVATVSTPLQFAAGETVKSATITALTDGSTTLIATVQGVERARMTVTVQGGIVTGLVLDPDLEPVAGAQVTVTSGNTVRTTTSEADGSYHVQGLPGPFVRVRALHEASGLYGVSTGEMPGGGFLELDVILLDAGSVRGIVRTPLGAAAGAGVQVAITARTAQDPEQTVFTDANGAYDFPLVTVGEYEIAAQDQAGNRGLTMVTVAGGQQLEKDVTFLGRGTVRGSVRTAGGQPVAGAALSFFSSSLVGSSTITRTADANGEFEFTGVFVGDYYLSATRAATGEGGSISGRINQHDETANVVVTLAPVGALEGRVLRTDGSTAPNAQVHIKNGPTATTDENGRYTFAFLPTGPVELTASIAATRERGLATATILAGQTTTRDITFAAQGRVQVTVTNASNQPVSGATVTLRVDGGGLSDEFGVVTGQDGTVLIDRVLVGSFYVTASANGLNGSATGTVTAGATSTASIKLQVAGDITGIVYAPGGQTPQTTGTVSLDRLRWMPIAADGTYRFTNVTPGSYELSVSVDGLRRAGAKGVVMPATGGEVTRNFELVGLGIVKGRVLNGANGVADMWVAVNSLHSELGHVKSAQTNAAGFYEVEGMVLGPIAVSAGSDSLRGEANGTLARSDTPLTLDIVLTNNATTLPQSLYDANASQFDVQMHGGLARASVGFYDAFLLDIVSGGQAFRFNGAGIPTQENGGRELATRQGNLAGLNVTRKVFVPNAGYFGRWLEILSNPTGAPITVDVRVTSGVNTPNTGWNTDTQVYATSSGDALLDVTSATPDRWVVVDDATDADVVLNPTGVPAVAFVFDGPEAAARVGAATHTVSPTGTGADKSVVRYTWTNVTIQPGQSVAFMHFGARQTSRASAAASAARLEQLPPEALAGLNPDELPIIRNFAVPEGGNSTLTPLAPLTGRVTGKALANDGTTPVGNVWVKLKSDSPFFGRTYTVSSASSATDGSFTLQGKVTGASWELIAIPTADTLTLTGTHPESQIAAPPATGTFADGALTATQDLLFSNSGMIRGVVRRTSGTPVASGTIEANYGTGRPQHTVGAGGSFLFTGVPAGSVALRATTSPGGVTAVLSGTATATVAIGQTTTQDVVIESTGTVTGLVKTAGGAPAVNVLVAVSRSGYSISQRTDSAGSYTFTDLPAAALTVSATDPVTGLATSTAVTAVADQSTTAPELRLVASGTLTVQVMRNGVAAGSNITVQITEVARGTTPRGAVTNANGRVIFNGVTTDGYTLKAFHPSDASKTTTQTGTIANGESKTVSIDLPSIGTVTLRVRYPDGTTPGRTYVERRGGLTGSSYTDNAGNATLTGLSANTAFTLRAYDPVGSGYRDSAPLQITSDGQTLPVDLTLPAMANLTVIARRGTEPATNVLVAIQDPFWESYGYTQSVDENGATTFERVSEGVVKIAIVTPDGSAILTESEFTIQTADHLKTVTATVDIGNALPRSLFDANGFEWDIQPDGQTKHGSQTWSSRAYEGGLRLAVIAGGQELPFVGTPASTGEASGRELVIRNPNPLAGLEVTRKVFVPGTGYFARYLETLHNPTAAPITVDLQVASEIYSGQYTHIVDQRAQQWVVLDDDTTDQWPYPESMQTLAHVFAGDGATLSAPVTTLPGQSTGAGWLVYRWNSVTVQPGQSVSLMHFAVQQTTQVAAKASAARLVLLPPEALADLSAPEIATIGNFAVPPVSSVPPLPMVQNFTITGRLLTADGTTPVTDDNVVVLKSSNPIYTRGTTVTTASAYQVTGLVVGSWVLEAHNWPPQPWGGWYSSTQVAGEIAEGQTSATQDVVFSNTGRITGRMRYGNNTPVRDGWLSLTLGNAGISVSSLPDNTFTLPVVPAGTYTMYLDLGTRQTNQTFTVTPNQTTDVQLTLPALATVRVQVLGVNGQPVPSADVWLNGSRRLANAQGIATYDFVNEGQFYVAAWEPNNGPHTAETMAVVRPEDEAGVVNVTLQFKALANLRVRVTRAGTPVENASVSIDYGDGAGHSGGTDADGVMLATNITAGPYSVRVTEGGTVAIGYASGVIPDTADGQTIDVPIEAITKTATVNGTIFAADGVTPLNGYNQRLQMRDGANVVVDDYINLGHYEYTNVPVPESGTLRVRAYYYDRTIGEDRFVEGDVAVTENQTSTRNLVLPLGGIVGRVTNWEGAPVVDNRVRFNFGGEGSDSAWTDEDGRYGLFGVPSGAFTGTAYYGEYMSRASGELTSETQVLTLDFQFGRVMGTVRYHDGTPVSEPFVTATQPDGEEENHFDAEPTGTDGTYEVRGPQPGPVTVKAQKFLLEGTATGHIASASPTTLLDITLEADGIVSGTVRDMNDVPQAGAAVVLAIPNLERETVTDATGRFQFTHVKLGGFMLQARVGTGPSAQFVTATGAMSAEAPQADVTLKLLPLMVIGGQVNEANGTPAANADVIVESLDHHGPLGAFAAQTSADGTGLFTAMAPVGRVKVSAFSGLFGGTVTGDVTTEGANPFNVTLGALVKLAPPFALDEAVFRFDIGCTGTVATGGQKNGSWSPTFIDAFSLQVNYQPFPCVRAAALEDNSRELVLEGGTIDGLLVTRKVYVPQTPGFVRYLEIVTNPGTTPKELSVQITGAMPSSPRPWVGWSPSSTGYRFASTYVLDRGSQGYVFAGPNAPTGAYGYFPSMPTYFDYSWYLTVQPGQTVILMHFAVQGEQSLVPTHALSQALSELSQPNALDGMSAEEKARVVNFRMP